MTLLALFLPPRQRAASAPSSGPNTAWPAEAASASASTPLTLASSITATGTLEELDASTASSPRATPWTYLLSLEGGRIEREGSAALTDLPKADRVVLLVSDGDVAWLPVALPRSTGARLRDALNGALEDLILEDTALVHFALSAAGIQDGQPTWVATLHKPWLSGHLETLRQAGVQVDAVVALAEPSAQWQAHAQMSPDGLAQAVIQGPEGVALAPLDWPGLKARIPQDTLWTAEPAAAAALSTSAAVIEAGNVELVSPSQRALRAAQLGSNLLQFDLAPQMKGSRALVAAWSAFKDRRWRAAHIGLAALIVVQLVGLNASAWRAQQDVRVLEDRSRQLLVSTFPSVQVVVDPAVQMEREVQTLRRQSGQPGPTDLETWIDLLAAIWVGQAEPVTALRLTERGLIFEAGQWPEDVVAVVRDYAQRHGWQVQLDARQLRVLRPQ